VEASKRPADAVSHHSDDPAVIVERLVRDQLRAMGCESFDIGIKRDTGEMMLREGQGAREIEATIKWLRHENAEGGHTYVQLAETHSLSLIDDLSGRSDREDEGGRVNDWRISR
jgi:hypothetical protein